MSRETGNEKIVVIAVDASVHAERSFNYFCEHLYQQQKHQVVLVHGSEYPRLTAGDRMAPDLWEMEVAKKEHEMKTMEEYYSDKMKCFNISQGKTRFVYHNKPGECIVHLAAELGASLVIVGARGSGTLRRTIIGSTSDYVIHHLKCAVLVCPPPPKGHEPSTYDKSEAGEHQHHDQQQPHGLFSRFVRHHHHKHGTQQPSEPSQRTKSE